MEQAPDQDLLLRQLARRLTILNIWLGIMAFFALGSLIIVGLVAWVAINFIHSTTTKIDVLQKNVTQKTNLTNGFCGQPQISQYLKDQSGLCQ